MSADPSSNRLDHARYVRSNGYDPDWVVHNQMGPNALWLLESRSLSVRTPPAGHRRTAGVLRGHPVWCGLGNDVGLLSPSEALKLATDIVAAPVTVERMAVGFGNENWAIRTEDGATRWVLKVASVDNEAKWMSAHLALDLARTAGVPVPELVHMGRAEDSLVRMFTWIDGHSPVDVIGNDAQRDRFVRSLAEAMRSLHTIDTGAFSSRLDGSAPQFERWGDYLRHRLAQVRQRWVSVNGLDSVTLERASEVVEELADSTSSRAHPTVCHRDLHADNLLVSDTGELVGIIDWDLAESWDRAGDWFKPSWMLADALALDMKALTGAYLGDDVDRGLWRERVRVVDVIETLNTVPNARLQADEAYEARARRRLTTLLLNS